MNVLRARARPGFSRKTGVRPAPAGARLSYANREKPVEIIRDPLWNNIRFDPLAFELIDTPAFQRLRYVRQLGLAFLVYPGATHSRFEHALGTYHLARRVFTLLEDQPDFALVDREDVQLTRLAALLHDIGHYPFSHALEEIGAMHHEDVARPLICEGEVAEALRRELGGRGAATHPRAHLRPQREPAAGTHLRLDRSRQARLSPSRRVHVRRELRRDRRRPPAQRVGDRARPRDEFSAHRHGREGTLGARVAPVRAVSDVPQRVLASRRAQRDGDVQAAGRRRARCRHARRAPLAAFTDEGLLHALQTRAPNELLDSLRGRRLYKRAFECPAADLSGDDAEWIADDPKLTAAVENQLAREVRLQPGELLLDYPAKTQMLGLDLLIQRPYGDVRRVTAAGWEAVINLPRLSEEFYRSARWLRVFTSARMALDPARFMSVARLPADEVRARLTRGSSLLA